MLTVHDCTFEVRWQGWGAHTPYAERAAYGVMKTILTMKPEEVRKLARSSHARGVMIGGARNAIIKQLALKSKTMSHVGVIELEGVECPKA